MRRSIVQVDCIIALFCVLQRSPLHAQLKASSTAVLTVTCRCRSVRLHILTRVVVVSALAGLPILHSDLDVAYWQSVHACDDGLVIGHCQERIDLVIVNSTAAVLVAVGFVGLKGSCWLG